MFKSPMDRFRDRAAADREKPTGAGGNPQNPEKSSMACVPPKNYF